jgi:hypothetical protein
VAAGPIPPISPMCIAARSFELILGDWPCGKFAEHSRAAQGVRVC